MLYPTARVAVPHARQTTNPATQCLIHLHDGGRRRRRSVNRLDEENYRSAAPAVEFPEARPKLRSGAREPAFGHYLPPKQSPPPLSEYGSLIPLEGQNYQGQPRHRLRRMQGGRQETARYDLLPPTLNSRAKRRRRRRQLERFWVFHGAVGPRPNPRKHEQTNECWNPHRPSGARSGGPAQAPRRRKQDGNYVFPSYAVAPGGQANAQSYQLQNRSEVQKTWRTAEASEYRRTSRRSSSRRSSTERLRRIASSPGRRRRMGRADSADSAWRTVSLSRVTKNP